MNWIDKMDKLRGKRSLADIEREAGWSLNSLSTTRHEGSVPNANKAVNLATALGVSADWLFDDTQAWPPPPRQAPPVAITPWPPHGITWEEMQQAISQYIDRRTTSAIEKLNRGMAGRGTELMVPVQPPPIHQEENRRRGTRGRGG